MYHIKAYSQGDVVAEAHVAGVSQAVRVENALLDEEHIEDTDIKYYNAEGVEEDKAKIIAHVYRRYLGL